MKNFNDLKKELLKNRDVKVEYEQLSAQFQVISQLIEAREKRGMTQRELAEKIGTKQSAISRLEAGNTNPSIGLLDKISKALDAQFVITVG